MIKKMTFYVVTMLLAMMLLTACQTNEDVGTGVGAVAGGLLGSQVGRGDGRTAAIIAGAMAGAYFGNQVGQRMDRVDRMHMQDATNQALNQDQDMAWHTGRAQGYVRPVHGERHYRHQICRSFETDVRFKDGRQQWSKARGCACKAHGSRIWRIQDPSICRHRR